MEQHPVPQNVTTFQFRLVGDMTIKQFGYLASGIILGYIFYKLPLPFFFTWPLAIGSGVLGFGLAFVPVEERPMDIWIASFFKNVYSPTQYVWSREARSGSAGQKSEPKPVSQQGVPQPAIHRTTGANMRTLINRLFTSLFMSTNARPPTKPATQAVPVTVLPQRQAPIAPIRPAQTTAPMAVLSLDHVNDPLAWFKKLFHSNPKVALSPGLEFNNALAPHQVPLIIKPQPTARVAPPVAPPITPPAAHPITHERVVELQGQLSDSLAERERLEKELMALHQQVTQQARASTTPPMRQASMTPTDNTTVSVRVFTPEAATKAGIPRLTTFPNIVTGIIKDHNGNLLPGMLITVRDNTDTPLRALKTNKLGQFAASTPLSNGTYVVEIEDPKNVLVFDKVQIPLNGAVAPPIEVVAKSQKRMERDRLAKEIFGTNQM
ncbi:MAG: PrgI family protein [Patescibacteria group bacterium]